MLTKFQTIFIQDILHNFTVKFHHNSELKHGGYKHDPPIGSCWLNISSKGTNIYHVYLDKTLSDRTQDIVTLHELGHIWYGHNLINTDKELEVIRKLIIKITHANSASKDICHSILNICMDLQINSEWMTFKDIDYMKSINHPMVTASYYQVDAGLDFHEYYEPVIKKSIKVISVNWTIDGNSDVGGARFIFDSDLVISDQDVFSSDESLKVEVGKNAGTSDLTSDLQIYDDSDKSLLEILQSILDVTVKMTSTSDSFRIYNRQSRGSSNLLYTSIKRKRNKVQDKILIRFYVDVSGSMNKRLLSKIFNGLSEFSKYLHKKSTLVTWNTELVKELPLDSSSLTELTSGGGTALEGIIDHASDIGTHKYVVISDFCTPAMDWPTSLPDNFYGIMYGNDEEHFRSMLTSRGNSTHMFFIKES